MAYVGKTSIASNNHMASALDYISDENKSLSLEDFKQEVQNRLEHCDNVNESVGERATYINCYEGDTAQQFEIIRKAFNQDKKIIAHHYYQSFSPDDEITPEQAHEIGVELAKKMFTDFQVVVSTHIDKSHIHNHIIVNSVNLETGQKWHSNKKTLAEIRSESNKLCLKNGLSIIDKHSSTKSLDRSTYQLAVKGKSWKLQLVNDISEAREQCKSKEDFIAFLESRDYDVKYRDIHITIQKRGEKKGIRVDTLAKQFGDDFKKENLEKAMGYYQPPPSDILEKYKPMDTKFKGKTKSGSPTQWQRFEKKYFQQSSCEESTPNNIVRSSSLDWALRNAQYSITKTNNPMSIVLRFIFCLFLKGKQAQMQINRGENVLYHRRLCSSFPKQYKTLRTENPNRRYRNFGNINYGKLKQAQGENFSVRVSLSRMLMLVNQPLFYSARIDTKTGTATITIKDYNKSFAAKLMGIENLDDVLEKQNEEISNRRIYSDLKKSAADSGTKLKYEIVDENQLAILKNNYIDFAYFLKEDGKINIAYLPEKREHIARLIHEQKPKETQKQRNNRIYAQLKTAAAKAGEKLRYITNVTSEQLDLLSKTDIIFAYHESKKCEGCFNISCLNQDYGKVREAVGITSGTRRKID